MISSKFKKILCALVIACTLICSTMMVKASSNNPFVLSPKSIITVNTNTSINQEKGKILLYHSHSCEKNIDSTIQDVAKDLKIKLERKGFAVEYINTDFANERGYNYSYHSSRKMLETKDLNSYALVIDLHFDASPNPISTIVEGKEVARLMFPTLSENPQLASETKIINSIKKSLDSFGGNIYKESVTHYKKGIIFYNLDVCPRVLLCECGSDQNNFISCQRAMTWLAAAINNYIDDNNNK